MLSQSYVLQDIEMKLGYKFNKLEVPLEDVMEVIRRRTLPVFSKYFPNVVRCNIDSKKDLVEGTSNIFYLNSETEIIGVNRLLNRAMTNTFQTLDGALSLPISNLYGDPISRQLDIDLMSAVKVPVTFQFIHPNKIQITPKSAALVCNSVLLNTVHPDYFGTIPVNMEYIFLELAEYDVKSMLYPIRRRFQNIQTSMGEFELFVDDLAEAEDKRKDLIKESFFPNSLKYSKRKKIYVG